MAIVVGFVPTDEGRAALRRAVSESRTRSTALLIVDAVSDVDDLPEEDRARFAADLAAARHEASQAGSEVTVRTPVKGRDLAEDVIAVAEEITADLIVIGLRRRSPVGKLILGSNAQKILLDAPCPVLAVKADTPV